jgi:predicted ATP-binding protein involved in virulence
LGYYGTGRLWSHKRLTKEKTVKKQKTDTFMRLSAYRDCLDPASSYKNFEDWFIWIFECYREEQIRQAEKGALHESNPKWKETILVVQQAINEVLEPETGWHDLEYSVSDEKSLVLNHPDYGKLKVEQLSDGIRGILAMVGDIAYRCVKLNWHLGANAAKATHGVVMIDEIEMHLHPAWQQNILGNLCKAFPNIQFIVTTHSPQVLSTVQSHQIRVLDEGQVHSASAGTKGAEVSRILKQVFGVDSRPQNDPNTQLLNEYLDLVYKDKWNEAKEQRRKLDEIYQGNEPALTEADLYIENRQWELEVEENQ